MPLFRNPIMATESDEDSATLLSDSGLDAVGLLDAEQSMLSVIAATLMG
jgi:hypothetical protein